MGHYDKQMEELRDAVTSCDSFVPRKIHYFLHEANTHSSGIPNGIEQEIESLASIFEDNCYCNKDESEPSIYKGGPYFSETGLVHGYKKSSDKP